jgi:hypothetical protein
MEFGNEVGRERATVIDRRYNNYSFAGALSLAAAGFLPL